jgi:lysozyme family protein
MTERFKNKIIPWFFEWEGTTYENDPDDDGGATKFGIDQRSHPSINIKELTAEQATDIYWSEYVKYACDLLSPPFDWVFFNACVNCGVGRAQKIYKQSGKDASKFLDLQDSFYESLAEAKPITKKYLKGWLARTKDLRKVTGLS